MKSINEMSREEWEDVLMDWQLGILNNSLKPDPLRDEMVAKYGEATIRRFEESVKPGDTEEDVDRKWDEAMEAQQ